MDNINFSFIIPVYNAEKTLQKCIDSILQRETDDYEILLLDDSSIDNSYNICCEYSNRHSRITCYSCSNCGAGAIRNKGLEKATGKYIIFCDADDYYLSDNLNSLLSNIETFMKDCDLYCFDYYKQWTDYLDISSHCSDCKMTIQSTADAIDIITQKSFSKKIGFIVWNKIYKKEIIETNNVHFPERDVLNNLHDWGEDLCFNIQYLLNCKTIKLSETPVYVNTIRIARGETDKQYFPRNKIEHMTRMLFSNKSTDTFIQKKVANKFYKIYIWHMFTYIDFLVQDMGLSFCRNEFVKSEYFEQIKILFIRGLLNWNSFSKKRWNKNERKRYVVILVFLLTGNETIYQILCKILRT